MVSEHEAHRSYDGALANAAVALWVDSLAPALVLFLTGVCLAGAYPPAMKVMATWFREGRGLAIGILIGALTVGSATPHLIRGATDLPWRAVLLAASVLALVSAVIVAWFVDEGPHRFPSARFDARMAAAVFRERGSRLACFGYFGHVDLADPARRPARGLALGVRRAGARPRARDRRDGAPPGAARGPQAGRRPTVGPEIPPDFHAGAVDLPGGTVKLWNPWRLIDSVRGGC